MQITDQFRTTVESYQGLMGYGAQLDRARRMWARLYSETEWAEDRSTEFQDDMMNTFQAIWHVKDWVKNDPILSTAKYGAKQQAIIAAAHASPILKICADICNGTKHFKLTMPRSGTGDGAKLDNLSVTRVGGFTVDMDCSIDTGIRDANGDPIFKSGKTLAAEGIKEWERILVDHGLPIAQRS